MFGGFGQWLKRVALGAAAAVLWLGPAQGESASHEPPELRFGVFAYLGEERTRDRYTPLATYLDSALPGHTVRLEVLSLADIQTRIAEGSLDIVTTNPTHFLINRSAGGLTGVIATLVDSHDGHALHHLGGAIVVRADRTDLRTLTDLRGMVIAAPSTEHIGGYRAQALELLEAGLHLPRDARVLTTGQHDLAVTALLDGRADAAFVRNGILEYLERTGAVAPGTLRLLNQQDHPGFPHRVSTRLYPEWPVFALPHVDEQAVRRFAAALFALEPDHPAAQAAGIHGYTIPADYLAVETLARRLRLPPFDTLPDITAADVWHQWGHTLPLLLAAALVITGLGVVLVVYLRRERAARQRFQLLLSSLGEGVYGVDLHGRCIFINPAALSLLGFAEAEVIGRDQHILFHHSHPDGSPYAHADCPVHKTLHDGAAREGEETFFHKGGNPMPVRMRVAPILAGRSQVGAVVAFADITALKAVTDDLRRSNAELEQFAYVVSHDLRQPLRMVNSYAQLLERTLGPQADATVGEFIGHIRDGARRMDQMLVSLLEYSRIGRSGEPMADHDSRALADEALQFLAPAIAEAQAQVRLNGDWPTIHASHNEIVRLIQNLVGNAVKYRAPDRPPVIDIASRYHGGLWEVAVVDNGIGINPAQFDRLFKVFQRLHTRTAFEGTGIGLAVCRKIVERHGGTIGVASDGPGTGTTFTVSLPLAGPATESAAE